MANTSARYRSQNSATPYGTAVERSLPAISWVVNNIQRSGSGMLVRSRAWSDVEGKEPISLWVCCKGRPKHGIIDWLQHS